MKSKKLLFISLIMAFLSELKAQDSTDVIWLEQEITTLKSGTSNLQTIKDSLYQVATDTASFVAKKYYLNECSKLNKKISSHNKRVLRLQDLLLIEEKKQTSILKSLQKDD